VAHDVEHKRVIKIPPSFISILSISIKIKVPHKQPEVLILNLEIKLPLHKRDFGRLPTRSIHNNKSPRSPVQSRGDCEPDGKIKNAFHK
jgi:hypothetical protein